MEIMCTLKCVLIIKLNKAYNKIISSVFSLTTKPHTQNDILNHGYLTILWKDNVFI